MWYQSINKQEISTGKCKTSKVEISLVKSKITDNKSSPSLHAQSCLTLCNPTDCRPPNSSIHRIVQARIWSGLPFPSPRDLPHPGIKPMSPAFPALAGELFTTESPETPRSSLDDLNNKLEIAEKIIPENLRDMNRKYQFKEKRKIGKIKSKDKQRGSETWSLAIQPVDIFKRINQKHNLSSRRRGLKRAGKRHNEQNCQIWRKTKWILPHPRVAENSDKINTSSKHNIFRMLKVKN